MHRHDLDLIADYASGTADDETRARRLIETCPTCAAEFEMQQSMMSELESIPGAAMTDHERSALHRDLWTQLRSGKAATPEPVRGFWWRNWAIGAAALLLVVVGVFGVLSNSLQMGADTSETFSEIAGDLNTARSGGVGDGEDGAGAQADEEAPGVAVPDALAERFAATPYAFIARSVRGKLEGPPAVAYEGEEATQCLVENGLEDHLVIDGYQDLTGLLIVVPQDADPEATPVIFIDPDTCTIVHVEE